MNNEFDCETMIFFFAIKSKSATTKNMQAEAKEEKDGKFIDNEPNNFNRISSSHCVLAKHEMEIVD